MPNEDAEEKEKEKDGEGKVEVDEGYESDPYEEGSDSDDSVDVGNLTLSKHHEEKKARKKKREAALSKPKRNFAQEREELKQKVIKEVLQQVMPDIGHYDVNAPPEDNGKRWYDPLIRIGKIFGLVTLTIHEAVLSGSENHLERALEKVHQGKKSNRPLLSIYDARGSTPLTVAVKTNQVAMVQMICARHADPHVADMETGRTPMQLAASIPSFLMVEFIINNGGNPAFGDYKNVTPLMMAAKTNCTRSLELMLNPRRVKGHFVEVDQVDDNGWTALHYAVLGKAAKTTRILIKNGADRNLKDGTGRSPTHLAHHLDEHHADGPGAWGLVIVELEDRKAKLA